MYFAIIGDIIGSKRIENRSETQVAIQKTLNQLNHTFSDLIESKITLTIGDEFQALLKPSRAVWYFLDQLTSQINVPLRFGLGFGKIRTQINPEQSLGADGEAFWRAREAIQAVHAQNWNRRSHVLFKGEHTNHDQIINTLVLSGETIKSQWTKSQKSLFRSLLKEGVYQADFNQKSIAEKLDFSESTLSKRLTASNIKIYFRLRETLGIILEDYNRYGNN